MNQPRQPPSPSGKSTTVVDGNDMKKPKQTLPTSAKSPGPSLQLGSSSLYTNLFAGKKYPFQIHLYDQQRRLIQGHVIPVELQVFFEGSDQPLATKEFLDYEPKELAVNNLGVLECSVTFRTVSVDHANRNFVLQFSISTKNIEAIAPNLLSPSDEDAAQSEAQTAAPCFSVQSRPLFVTSRKFSIQLEINNNTTYAHSEDEAGNGNGNGNSGQQPQSFIWYKDEGGKDHGIELTVSLVDKDGRPILGEEVPFLISLHYQHHLDTALSGQTAAGLYSILPDGLHAIDKFAGRASKKLRIHDISKNHQRQLFVIKIAPDISKSARFFDIAPEVSLPIEVRSKRSKRLRQDLAPAGGDGDSLMAAGKKIDAAASEPHQLKKQRSLGQAQSLPMALPAPPQLSAAFASEDGLSEGDWALLQLTKWTEAVIAGLQAIRWHPIGFQNHHPDQPQAFSLSEPLYSIHNPNEQVDQLLAEYSKSVHQALSLLILQQQHSQQQQAQSEKRRGSSSRSKIAGGSASRGKASASTSSLTLPLPAHFEAPATSSSQRNGSSSSFLSSEDGGYSNLPAARTYPEAVDDENQKDWRNVLNFIEQANAKINETQVFFIISKPYDFQKNELLQGGSHQHSSDLLYFPAYDANHSLVGFYTETKDNKSNSTMILFIPINSPIISPDLINFATAKAILEEKLLIQQQNPSAVMDLHSLDQKMNNFDLEALKHNAIVHYWFSEIGLDEF